MHTVHYFLLYCRTHFGKCLLKRETPVLSFNRTATHVSTLPFLINIVSVYNYFVQLLLKLKELSSQ